MIINAKDEAEELVKQFLTIDFFNSNTDMFETEAVQCALIAIQGRIDLLKDLDEYFLEAGHNRSTLEKAMEIQLEIKQEIEKL